MLGLGRVVEDVGLDDAAPGGGRALSAAHLKRRAFVSDRRGGCVYLFGTIEVLSDEGLLLRDG